MMAKPLSTIHVLFRANGSSGKAQVQYQGFCVGSNSQNQANVRNAASKKTLEEALLAACTANQPRSAMNAAEVIARLRKNGARPGSMPKILAVARHASRRHDSGTIENHATSSAGS